MTDEPQVTNLTGFDNELDGKNSHNIILDSYRFQSQRESSDLNLYNS